MLLNLVHLILKIGLSFGWILSITTILLVLYGMLPFLDEELVPELNPFVRVTYTELLAALAGPLQSLGSFSHVLMDTEVISILQFSLTNLIWLLK